MKRIALLLCAGSLLLACNNDKKTEDKKAETTVSDGKTTPTTATAKPEVDSATRMRNWQEYMTPGDMQKMMAKWDGNWNGDVTMWEEPGKPEMKSTTRAMNKMIMNGMYQQSTHSGNMMGMPFNGMSIVGYDNHLKEFVSTWIDNMGSGIMVMKGPWDAATKTITMTGKMVDPGTKAICDMKETFTVIDDNTQEMKMFVIMPDGKEFQNMNIRFTRAK